jgi:hypothetical protein
MNALSETLFWLDGPESGGESRVQFVLDDDRNVEKLVALFPDGRTISFART